MSITFGGLATGLDTNAIVDQLMELERQPISRLEGDRTWYQARQEAYGNLDSALRIFQTNISNLDSSDSLRKKSVSASRKDLFSVTAGADALPGASYQVEVVSLAQVQKNVSQGYASKTAQSFGTGDITFTVGANAPVSITVDATNNSLEGIMTAINDADLGLNASIINDGTSSPYRLVLTGDDVATSFSMASTLPTYNGDVSAQLMSGGFASETATYFGGGTLDLSTGDQITLGGSANSLTDMMDAINAETGSTGVTASIVPDGSNFVIALSSGATITSTALTGGNYDPLSLTETQAAAQAHIRVDSIDIYSDSNTLTEALPGLTVDLAAAELGATTNVSVSLDEAGIKSQIESFVTGYNEVMSFIGSQSVKDGVGGGILGGDSVMNNVKRRLQNLLTTSVSTTGNFLAFSQLGLETQKDGTITLDDTKLTDAIQNNLDSVEKLLVGEGTTDGIAVQFQDYLDSVTSSSDGLKATNAKSTDANIDRIDSRIEIIETRLAKKEETMRKKFTALENLISGMNSQSTFLTQQMDLLNNMMTRNN